jgi:hypothetical protein
MFIITSNDEVTPEFRKFMQGDNRPEVIINTGTLNAQLAKAIAQLKEKTETSALNSDAIERNLEAIKLRVEAINQQVKNLEPRK